MLRPHFDIVALADVVDVHGNRGVRADAVFLHQPNELRLTEWVRRGGTALGTSRARTLVCEPVIMYSGSRAGVHVLRSAIQVL